MEELEKENAELKNTVEEYQDMVDKNQTRIIELEDTLSEIERLSRSI